MNINSCYTLLLIIHGLEQMNLLNVGSSIDICKGKDVDMLWKFDAEENRISRMEWYFNEENIFSSSSEEKFTVMDRYQGRIERIGRTAIRMKNVSLDDEGTYILFPLLNWSASENKSEIVLRVLEPPTDKCTCQMGLPPDVKCELMASHCGRPRVSVVWKRKQTFEVLGEGNWIMNSTLQDVEILGCLEGEAMKCVNDSRQFCTTVSFPHQDDERQAEGKPQHTVLVTVLVIVGVVVLMVVLVFVAMCIKRKRKNKKNNKALDVKMQCLQFGGMGIKTETPQISDDDMVPETATINPKC